MTIVLIQVFDVTFLSFFTSTVPSPAICKILHYVHVLANGPVLFSLLPGLLWNYHILKLKGDLESISSNLFLTYQYFKNISSNLSCRLSLNSFSYADYTILSDHLVNCQIVPIIQKAFLCFHQSSITFSHLTSLSKQTMYHVSFSWHVFLHLRIALLSLSHLLFSMLKFTIYAISTSCGRFENPLISVIISLKGSSLSMSVLKCWCRSRYKTLRLLAWKCLELSRQLKITFFFL